MSEINLKVKGMMCGGCENRVKNALENIDGVEKATADHATGNVNVIFNDATTKETIEETIEDIGYEIVEEN